MAHLKTVIRPAKVSELPYIGQLVLNEFVSETHSHIPELESSDDTSIDGFCSDFKSRLEQQIPTAIFIAERGDEIIGAAAGSVNKHPWAKHQMWGSEDFWYVKKEERGTSVGIKLFNMLMDWFKENGANRIHMVHYHWNQKVSKFYARKGFVPFEVSYVKVV